MNKEEPKYLSRDKIRDQFDWLGTVTNIYEVGEYQIVEYFERDDVIGRDRPPRLAYGAVMDGRRETRGWTTLDRAMIGVVALKYDGCNTQADRLFARAIGLPDPDDHEKPQ